jgi:hypothetical protein
MPKTTYDDDDMIVYLGDSLAALPANWRTAPLATELNAGEDWSLHVLAPFDLDVAPSDTIDQRAVGEPSSTQVFGKRNATGTLDYFRHYLNGQPHPADDIVHNKVNVRGNIIVLARREGGKIADLVEQPFANGDEISIWVAEVDEVQTPKEDGYRRGRAPLTLKQFEKGIIVGGASESSSSSSSA